MTEIQATLLRLKVKKNKQQPSNGRLMSINYSLPNNIVYTYLRNVFFTASAVLDPGTGAALEYPQLKLGENAKRMDSRLF